MASDLRGRFRKLSFRPEFARAVFRMVGDEREEDAMREIPEWARRVIRDECRRAGVRQPAVTWRERDGGWSTGHYYDWENRIAITVGGPHIEQLGVLLHELAHHIAGRARTRTNTWHGKHFIRVVRRLYLRHGVLHDRVLEVLEYATVRRSLLRGTQDLSLDMMLTNIAQFLDDLEARAQT